MWTHAEHSICQITEPGRTSDPLAGRRPASPTQLGARGLLMVNHLADLVRTHTRPHETTIRAYFRLPPTPPTIIDGAHGG